MFPEGKRELREQGLANARDPVERTAPRIEANARQHMVPRALPLETRHQSVYERLAAATERLAYVRDSHVRRRVTARIEQRTRPFLVPSIRRRFCITRGQPIVLTRQHNRKEVQKGYEETMRAHRRE